MNSRFSFSSHEINKLSNMKYYKSEISFTKHYKAFFERHDDIAKIIPKLYLEFCCRKLLNILNLYEFLKKSNNYLQNNVKF